MIKIEFKNSADPDVVAHIFNPTIRLAEADLCELEAHLVNIESFR